MAEIINLTKCFRTGKSSLGAAACAVFFAVACSGPDADKDAAHKKQPAAASEVVHNYLISGDSVGDLRVGSSVDNVYRIYGQERLRKETYEQEGMAYTALEVYLGRQRKPSLVLALNCDTVPCLVRSIAIRDSAFHTRQGLRLGSTYGELKKKQKTAYVGWGETAFVAVAEGMPLTFEMDLNSVGESDLGSITAATLPDSTRVKGLFMFNPRSRKPLQQRPEQQE